MDGKIMKTLKSFFLEKEQLEKLKKLSAKTKVPQAVYVREGMDLVLNRYLKKTRKKKVKRGVKHNKSASLRLLKG